MKFRLFKKKVYCGSIDMINDNLYLIISKDLRRKMKRYPTYDIELKNTNSIILKVGYSFPFKLNKIAERYALFIPTKIICHLGKFDRIIINLEKEGRK